MVAQQRTPNESPAVRSSDAVLEREWLLPIDAELAAFAEEIGAQIEYNPDGYARRRLFKHHRDVRRGSREEGVESSFFILSRQRTPSRVG
ncbi:hypothetical protein H8D79_00365 [PVC group bacterium]|nr:hypothetical protein [PVC group bacterium]